MNNLQQNVVLFLRVLNLKQKDLAKIAIIDQTNMSKIVNGAHVGNMTLKRISYALSVESGIPREKFEDGQALVNRKPEYFKSLLEKKEQSLHVSEPPTPFKTTELEGSYDIQPYIEPELSAFEKNLPYYLRCINGGQLSNPTIERLLRYIELTGIDSETEISLIQTLESMRRYPPHAGPGRRRYREMDNQDDEK